MTRKTLSERKGQSAIEYLMTYGWMLLVVAIVGGAILATVQGQCAQQETGFTGESAAVISSEVTSSNLQLEVSNQAGDQINITSIDVGDGTATTWTDSNGDSVGDGIVINVGESEIFSSTAISSSDACNEYDVELTFDRGDFEDATSSGTISGNMGPT